MLQQLREGAKSKVAWAFIGVLLVLFALSGSEALFLGLGGGPDRVATVNGEPITRLELDRAVNMRRNQMSERFGDMDDSVLREPVLNGLIQRRVVTDAARSSGMAVSDQVIDQMILNTPEFAVDGTFNRNRYQQLLRSAGYTPSTYRIAMAEDVLHEQLNRGIVSSNFVTPLELEQLLALSWQTRDFNYTLISAEEVLDAVEVSEEEVVLYYEQNPGAFTAPEQVAVDYIDLSVSDLMDDIEVPEDLVRRQYEENIAGFTRRTERRAAHIQFDDENDPAIDEVIERLEAGEDFAVLAEEYSQDLGSRAFGGELGYTSGDTFPEAFEAALAELTEGEVSDPVVTSEGVHLIKLLEVRTVEPPTFAEQRDDIETQLKRAEAEHTFVDLLESLRESSYLAEDLAEVAEELDLPLGNTGLFSRDGGSGLAANQQVVREAFSEEVLEEGRASHLLELSPDRVAVIKQTQHQPSYLRDIDSVREQIVSILREQKARELLAERGAELIARAREVGLAQAAEAAELPVTEGQAVERGDTAHTREAISLAFTLPRPSEGALVQSRHTRNGDYLVVELLAVNDPDPADITEQERDAVRIQLAQLAGRQEYAGLQDFLRDKARIRHRD